MQNAGKAGLLTGIKGLQNFGRDVIRGGWGIYMDMAYNQTSALFMQPNAYAGDFQQPEQRVGQIGFRFSF